MLIPQADTTIEVNGNTLNILLLLLELLRIKFEDGTDLGNQLKLTTGKSLAEAGRSRSFATGLTLNHHHALDRTKWATNGNLLGRSLMTVRDELNN